MDNNKDVSVKDWIITHLILLIPIVNIVMIFVWAFGSSDKPSKANFFKAQLILMIIFVLFIIAFTTIIGASFFSFLRYI